MGSGGVPPYMYTLAPGSSLPAGLTLDPMMGTVSGMTMATGTFPFTAIVTDSSPGSAAAAAVPAVRFRRGTRSVARLGAAGPRVAMGTANFSVTIAADSPTDIVLNTESLTFNLPAGSAATPATQSMIVTSPAGASLGYLCPCLPPG